MKFFSFARWALLLLLCAESALLAQGRPYDGPDDPASDVAAERAGWMTGNRVLLFFRNTTELGDCCNLGYDVSKWPNNFEGTKMHDGIAVLLGARVYLENDSIPVTDLAEIQSRTDLDTLHYIQSSYREFMDFNELNTVEWALYPVFGYFNELSETPALSNRPQSWPPAGWPAQGSGLKWPGEWNGRFGRGVMKADQESFFVANDAHDLEYLGVEDTVKYYPRPGVRIGDKKPDVTIQKGEPWGGLGLRVEVRGFQWNNVEATDAIFWEYNITNISDYDLPEAVFGYLLDNAVGGEEGAGDDIGFYNTDLNMCFSWDFDGIPVGGGREPGVLGLAFLESPGIPFDGIDNDNDGLLDEKRDNVATRKVGPTEGIHNLGAFLDFYNLTPEDLKEHWDADEDQDWIDGTDINGDGIYQQEDDPGDDLGLDGVGPFDINYTGPDADGTEANHMPDFVEGIGAEPNFAVTDVNESDMLGLTSFHYLLSWPRCVNIVCADEELFNTLTSGTFDDIQPTPVNFIEYFASGKFPLFKGRTERVSMSELHSYDPLSGLSSLNPEAPALFRLKETAQIIYERDYRFAQPPLTPTLKATPADGKVILSWDTVSDTKTRDAFVGNKNDFEGYKLYRATDPKIADSETITDGFGTPLQRKPIFQCDLIDNINGFTDFGYVNGLGYYLGDDSGIQHYFVDNTVQNGRTYYYVLVAYDYGIPEIGDGIAPSENNFVIDLNEQEQIVEISKNVQVVTPHQNAAGYVAPKIDELKKETFGTNTAEPEILVPTFVKNGHEYSVKFLVDSLGTIPFIEHGLRYKNRGLQVFDLTDGYRLVYEETEDNFANNNFVFVPGDPGPQAMIPDMWLPNVGEDLRSSQFEGLILNIKYPVLFAEYDRVNSGWLTGEANINIVSPSEEVVYFPYDFDIVFTDDDSAYVGRTRIKSMRDEDGGRLDQSELLVQYPFNFYVLNNSVNDSTGSPELQELVVHDINRNGQYDFKEDRILVGPLTTFGGRRAGLWAGLAFVIDFRNVATEAELPKPNDVYRVKFNRPFTANDSVTFKINVPQEVSETALNETMDQIKVVPNPYVATNAMEPAVANFQRNQSRRLLFTNIPAQCTIKIYTVSGVLVDVIEVDNAVGSRQNDWDLNSEANGTVHWDLLTREGLEIAAGYYLYHVKAHLTGKEFVGKFAIIK